MDRFSRLTILAFSILLVSICGACTGTEKPKAINGVVCTKPGNDGGYIGPGGWVPDDYLPIADAVVYLAQIKDPETPIAGFRATTKADGSYQITLAGLPPSEDSSGQYLLVAKKSGFESYSLSWRIGVLSPYLDNTIALVKSHKNVKRGKPVNRKTSDTFSGSPGVLDPEKTVTLSVS